MTSTLSRRFLIKTKEETNRKQDKKKIQKAEKCKAIRKGKSYVNSKPNVQSLIMNEMYFMYVLNLLSNESCYVFYTSLKNKITKENVYFST